MTNSIQHPTLRTLSLSFDLPLSHRQIPQWRGAFVELAGLENDLFHNHQNELKVEEVLEDFDLQGEAGSSSEPVAAPATAPGTAYHYRYPLIQYRAMKGQASLFALNEGIEAVQTVLSNNTWNITWEKEPLLLQITGMQMQEYQLRMFNRPKTYQLYKWLALNPDNYEKWQRCSSLVERAALLERVLAGHILAFASSIGWRLPERLEVQLQNINATNKVVCHGAPVIAFDVTYSANILLPAHIALGKSVSHGFGWQIPFRPSSQNQ